jgi:predicted RNase H-like nuclease (RuvC/YqgF family)
VFMMSPEKALSWVNGLYIAAVVVAAVGTYAIYRLSATITANKDRELSRFQAESQTKIAEANARSDEARASAALAVRGQKKLEVTAEQARARQKELEVQAEGLRKEQEQLRKQNLELQRQVEKERMARLQIEQRLADRRVSEAQRKILLTVLVSLQGTDITMESGNGPEIERYGTELADAFRSAGFNVTLRSGIISFPSLPAGLSMVVEAGSEQPSEVIGRALREASLVSAPIPADLLPIGEKTSPPGTAPIVLRVGKKP